MYLKSGISLESSYKDILRGILENEIKRETRDTSSLELSPFVWTTTYPLRNVLTNKVRNINHAYAIIEFLWIMSGRTDIEMLAPYNSNIIQFSRNKLSLTGAYGPKINQQLQYVVDTLKHDEGSRQAIVSIWERRPSLDQDIPCTLSLQFLRSMLGLDLIVTMRSNDVWLGFPYDVFSFTMIQSFVAHKLKLEVGRYTHQVASEHLYLCNRDKAELIAKSTDTMFGEIFETPKIISDDLEQTMLIEQKLRRAYLSREKNKLDENLKEIELVPEPWNGWLKIIRNHLQKKLK